MPNSLNYANRVQSEQQGVDTYSTIKHSFCSTTLLNMFFLLLVIRTSSFFLSFSFFFNNQERELERRTFSSRVREISEERERRGVLSGSRSSPGWKCPVCKEGSRDWYGSWDSQKDYLELKSWDQGLNKEPAHMLIIWAPLHKVMSFHICWASVG